MSDSYTKLDSGIIHSTVWRCETLATKVTWVTMLALKNRHGEVHASIPGLANAAGVTIPEAELALERFRTADPYSRTKGHDGRRIEDIPGGWLLLNHAIYRELGSDDDIKSKAAERAKRYRDRKRDAENVTRDDVTERDESRKSLHTDAVTDITTRESTHPAEPLNGKPPRKRRTLSPIPEDWRPNPSHADRAGTLGVALETEAEKFFLWATGNDARKANWDRAFTGWLLRAHDFAGVRR